MLNNPRHEAFALSIARGMSKDAAYVAAGYSRNSSNASRLSGHERIIARVGEHKRSLQNLEKRSSHRAVLTAVLTKDYVVEELIGVVTAAKARDKFDSAGANKALHLLGLHLGMFVERKEAGKPGEFDGMTMDAKRERLGSIMAQIRGGRFVNSHLL